MYRIFSICPGATLGPPCDIRGEHGLIPLLCDMLLDAGCEDTCLWSPILADSCRYPDLCRVLILRVFPRLSRSTVGDAFARNGSSLAPSWEEVIEWSGFLKLVYLLSKHSYWLPSRICLDGNSKLSSVLFDTLLEMDHDMR